jgi:acetolactate synthase-1/2/3 large subunit
MPKMTAAQAVARFLKSVGTEHYFLYNGHANWGLLDALEYDARIRGIRTRHECHAIHMADNYWRMRRRLPIPVTCTTTGPGNYNTVAAIAEAFFDSTPMLCLMGGGPTRWFGRGGIQETYRYGEEEFIELFRPITKHAVMTIRPDTALQSLIRAYKIAVTGRPGPVVVHMPLDVQNSVIDAEIPEAGPWIGLHAAAPDPEGVGKAVELLARAERPFCYVGTGVSNARAWNELRQFAESLSIPVGTTFGAKGSLPEDHPLSLGVCDRSGTGHAVNAATHADVVIGIGTHFNDLNTAGWSFYDFGGKQTLVHVDIDPAEIGRVYPTAVGLVGDARLALRALVEAWRARGLRRSGTGEWLEQIRTWKAAWEAEVLPLRSSEEAPLHYARLVSDASQVINEMDPETAVICDTGFIMNFLPAFYTLKHPWFATNNQQFGQMGFGPPGIVGAGLARPEHPVVVFVGDQSFIHTGLSLATATEYGLAGVVIVLNNRTIQAEIEGAMARFGRGVGDHYRIEQTGELWNPDIELLGRAMRAEVFKVAKPGELKPALRAALTSGKLCVVDVECSTTVPRYGVALIKKHGTMPFPYTWSE